MAIEASTRIVSTNDVLSSPQESDVVSVPDSVPDGLDGDECPAAAALIEILKLVNREGCDDSVLSDSIERRRRRRGDEVFGIELKRRFRKDPAVLAAMNFLESGDSDPVVGRIIRNLLGRVFMAYELKRENDTLFRANIGLRVDADTDGLTGLFNQKALREFGDGLMRCNDRRDIAYVMGDIDRFKVINDTHGHSAGDEVLRRVGNVLEDTARGIDVVGRDGGEEFGVIMFETDLDGACDFAERLRKNIEELDLELSGHLLPVTMSFGVAARAETDKSFADLRERADKGLYAAKNEHGRNAVVLSPHQGHLRCISPPERFRYGENARDLSLIDSIVDGLRKAVRALKAI